MQRSTVSAFTRVFDARCGALLNPGGGACVGPGSALHREERCTASGTRVYDLARKRNLDAPGATKQPGGQISA
jgi:hypothetical protein